MVLNSLNNIFVIIYNKTITMVNIRKLISK